MNTPLNPGRMPAHVQPGHSRIRPDARPLARHSIPGVLLWLTLATAILWLLAAGLPAQAQLAENVTEFRLENGMHVVVIEDHRVPAVNHTLWYRVGSIDEPQGKSGLAHFVEHLMFKGTENVPVGEYERSIRSRGGSSGASTSYDFSLYRARIASEHLEEIMRLEADRMHGIVLEGPEVDSERDVIIEERNERTDSDPSSLLREQMTAALYLNHPYGRPVIGWRHEMEQLSREDVLKFYRQHYRVDNSILVVSGDVTAAQVRELAEKHYGSLAVPDSDLQRIITAEPPHLAERRLKLEDSRVSNPYVLRRYLAPDDYKGDQHKLASIAILANLLGDSGITSALGKKLQLERSVAAFTGASYRGNITRPVELVVFILPTPEHTLQEAETALDEALLEFIEEGVDEAQLQRVKAQLKYNQIYELDDTMTSALKFGRGLVQGLTVEQILAWPEALQQVESEDVLEAAQLLLDRRRSVTGWLLKEGTEL
ncbi:MAG: pitrilysin family protein [Rhodobacteraceae bacterium]|nr:pitrilysin family protein [Paracoccaceae bacterium]